MQHGAILRAFIPMNADRTLTGEGHFEYVKRDEANKAVRALTGFQIKGASISAQKQSERVTLQVLSEELFDKTVSSIRFEIEKITGAVKRIVRVKHSRNKVNLTYQTHELAKQAKESMKRKYPECDFVKKDSGLGTVNFEEK